MKLVFLALTLAILSADTDHPFARKDENGRLGTQEQKLRVVPDDFKQIDFNSSSYPYTFSSGKRINIALKHGRYEYDFPNDRGWFNLSDVYYVDLSNDKSPEAIVALACFVWGLL